MSPETDEDGPSRLRSSSGAELPCRSVIMPIISRPEARELPRDDLPAALLWPPPPEEYA